MSDKRPEQSIASARASVMIYDDLNKKWIPSGTSHGLSKVHIYHHFINNTFRVVGRKLQDHEVVINCAILKSLKYNQATPTFHQWRDNKQVYGLNFSSKDDAEIFAAAMLRSLEILNTGGQLAVRAAPPAPPAQPLSQPQQPPQPMQPNNRQAQQQQIMSQQQQQQQYQQYPVYQQPHQHQSSTNDMYDLYDEYNHSGGSSNHYGGSDGGYEVHPNQQQFQQEEMERRLSLQQQQLTMLHTVSSSPNMSQPPTAINSPGSSQPSPDFIAGHHRTSSAPPPPQGSMTGPPAPPPPPAAPPAPPAPAPPQVQPTLAPAPPPPPPPNSNYGGGAPPPPPPPLPNFGSSAPSEPISGLAAALQAAKLRKTAPKATENSGGSTSSSGSSGSGYGTIGKGKEERPPLGGMASMMDEMQKTLARRRAKVDKAEEEQSNPEGEQRKGFEKSVSPGGKSGGSESPKPGRRRFGSTADEIDVTRLNGVLDNAISNAGPGCTPADLETLKQDILKEMRIEMNKMKQEIIEAFRCEMNRR